MTESSPQTEAASVPKWQMRYLYLTVFISGMVSLAIELSASRLLGNIYGTSNLVWANVIGLMLIYLTVGYFVGGRWADRSPHFSTLYRIIVWAAFLCVLVPLIARPILRAVASIVGDLDSLSGADVGLALGSFVSILVLFAVPVTLLGCVSPFVIRLAIVKPEDAGKVSGGVYAISTLGSIIGTFTPVLIFIPTLGTTRTFLVFGLLLLIVGFGGLFLHTRRLDWRILWMPIVLAILAALVLGKSQRPAPDGMSLLYERDSAYNLIQVVEDDRDGMRYLLLNEGQGYHSQWHPEQVFYGRTWDYFLMAPFFNAPSYRPTDIQNLAIIGLAGGTIARQYTDVYGEIPIDGFEIDGEIIKASRQYLGMTMPNLNVVVQDGRYGFNQMDKRYSVVGIDAYRVPYVPWHLTTVEFFEEIRAKLTDDGVVVINVGRTPSDRRLVDALSATMLEVFPSVYAMDVPNSLNTILVATRQPTREANLNANWTLLDKEQYPILGQIMELAIASLVPLNPSDTVFTDDHAPVEQIIDSMVLEYLIGGN